ncbi:MAG: hypothetical protein MZW92_50280 [Comamonadaceae bacterium]|nr:hypothetical protein [Comamonadaceae bacterium]
MAGLFSAGIQAADPDPQRRRIGRDLCRLPRHQRLQRGRLQRRASPDLSKRYLQKAMHDFKYDLRPSTIMGRIARGYSDQELVTIAAYFGDLEVAAGARQHRPEERRWPAASRTNGASGVPAATARRREKNEQETPGAWPANGLSIPTTSCANCTTSASRRRSRPRRTNGCRSSRTRRSRR